MHTTKIARLSDTSRISPRVAASPWPWLLFGFSVTSLFVGLALILTLTRLIIVPYMQQMGRSHSDCYVIGIAVTPITSALPCSAHIRWNTSAHADQHKMAAQPDDKKVAASLGAESSGCLRVRVRYFTDIENREGLLKTCIGTADDEDLCSYYLRVEGGDLRAHTMLTSSVPDVAPGNIGVAIGDILPYLQRDAVNVTASMSRHNVSTHPLSLPLEVEHIWIQSTLVMVGQEVRCTLSKSELPPNKTRITTAMVYHSWIWPTFSFVVGFMGLFFSTIMILQAKATQNNLKLHRPKLETQDSLPFNVMTA